MKDTEILGPHDRPSLARWIPLSFQHVFAMFGATILVPLLTGLSPSTALFTAGTGTLIYILITSAKVPAFLGSSFAFIGSMVAAFAGATASVYLGYLGLILGALFAGLVYVVIALIVKFVGVGWINKLMPAVVIGPTVAIIGLSLAGAAIKDVFSYGAQDSNGSFIMSGFSWVSFVCAIVTFFVVVICSTYGKKMVKLIPFIIGILAGYAVGLVFTLIGYSTGNDALKIIDFAPFQALVANGVELSTFIDLPQFAFANAIKGIGDFKVSYLATIAVAYVPVAFVVFAEHIADHKNLSSIIDKDLLEEPGLHRTLLGDGVGSIAGAFFGGCPNTTYGESVGCVAITRNASVATITTTAVMAVLISFVSPFVAFLDSIPGCVMGGVCITLYGFIAVSGLKMIQKVDLEDNANLFTVSVILIAGIGGMAMKIGQVTITSIAGALILGIITNIVLHSKKKSEQ